MSSLYSNIPLVVVLSSLGFLLFFLGFTAGLFSKSSYQKIIKTNQNHGEASVRKFITTNFSSPQYHLLNNLTIPFQDGTTQIDQILISTKGVFIIETKNYSGWIFGDEKSKQWTQVLFKVKNKFQNPIHQNFLHLKAIEELFDFIPKKHIHAIVVFTGKGEFKTPTPNGVYQLNDLFKFLNTFQDDVISTNRVQFCVGRLECKRYEITKTTDIQHQAYLSQKFSKSES